METFFLFKLASIGYFISFLYTRLGLSEGKKVNLPYFYSIFLASFLIQLAGLYAHSLEIQACPTKSTFGLAQTIISATVLMTFLVLPLSKLRTFSWFIALLSAFLSLISLYLPQRDFYNPIFANNPWVQIHIALAIISYSLFALMSISSLMFLMQDYGLSQKRFDGIYKYLPSLSFLDFLSYKLQYMGVCLLFVSIFLGFIIRPDYPTLSNLKLWSTLGVFVSYSILLVCKHKNYFLAKTFSKLSLALFFISFFGLWLFRYN